MIAVATVIAVKNITLVVAHGFVTMTHMCATTAETTTTHTVKSVRNMFTTMIFTTLQKKTDMCVRIVCTNITSTVKTVANTTEGKTWKCGIVTYLFALIAMPKERQKKKKFANLKGDMNYEQSF